MQRVDISSFFFYSAEDLTCVGGALRSFQFSKNYRAVIHVAYD